MKDLSDEEFSRRRSVDDRAWLDELFRRQQGRIVGCAHRMVTPSEVDDAVQEIAVRVLRGLPRFREGSSLGTWVYAVARHTCLDVRRRRRMTVELDETSSDYHREPSARIDDGLDMSIVACRTAVAISELPEIQQQVVFLRLVLNLSTEEAARRLGASEDSVKSKLRRARSSLREALTEVISCPQCGPGSYSLDADGVATLEDLMMS